MKNFRNFTAIMEKEDDSYVALCPEIDVASQALRLKKQEIIYRKQSDYFWKMHQKKK